MSELNDFLNKVGAAVQRTADKVNTEVTIAAQEQKVKEYYQALGKLYYQRSQVGPYYEGEEFEQLVKKIREGLDRIAVLRGNQTVYPEEDFVDL